MHSPEIIKEITNAFDLIEWLHDQLHDLFIPREHNIPCTLYYISIQHSEAAIILLDNYREGPAFTLARPTYECFLRALWFSVKASPEQKKDCLQNDNFPPLRTIVGTFNKPEESGLIKLYSDIKILHSFTHGGIQQIFNYLNQETLESSFKPADIKTLINTCLRLAIASSLQMTQLLGATEVSNSIYDRYKPAFSSDSIFN